MSAESVDVSFMATQILKRTWMAYITRRNSSVADARRLLLNWGTLRITRNTPVWVHLCEHSDLHHFNWPAKWALHKYDFTNS